MVSVLFIEYQIALIALLFIAIQFHFFCAVFIFYVILDGRKKNN